MDERVIRDEQIESFARHLREEEKSAATVEKYVRAVRKFQAWLGRRPAAKEATAEWKEHLLSVGRSPATVNGALTALDGFFGLFGWQDCRVRHLRLQRRLFCDSSRELTRAEYGRLVEAADPKLALVMETLCATGIRVSELRYITVQSAQSGRAEIRLKGKIRTILLPGKLCRKLKGYARKNKIASGELFLDESGKGLSRKRIWERMKAVCRRAKVEAAKVFPHNLRHLFARCFYQACRDVAKLADVLGHSSMETTRIYLISTGDEHAKLLGQLRLVS